MPKKSCKSVQHEKQLPRVTDEQNNKECLPGDGVPRCIECGDILYGIEIATGRCSICSAVGNHKDD